MTDRSLRVILKDSTLREGLDTPGVAFSLDARLRIARLLAEAQVPEIEVVAPSRVTQDLDVARRIRQENLRLRTTGLVYAYSPSSHDEISESVRHLDRLDILMPVSPRRRPTEIHAKIEFLDDALSHASRIRADVGAGFPHATQTRPEIPLEIAREAVRSGAKRLTFYDTNGSSDPFAVRELITFLRGELDVPLFFHAHNDLGLATANSLAAVGAGAAGVDVTVNGLGDRAGNASLEQVALGLALKGFETSVPLRNLVVLCKAVEEESGIPVSKLAPVAGEFVLHHKSPSHLEAPDLFEAFDPALLGATRKLSKE